jgi:hypothetical protein
MQEDEEKEEKQNGYTLIDELFSDLNESGECD